MAGSVINVAILAVVLSNSVEKVLKEGAGLILAVWASFSLALVELGVSLSSVNIKDSVLGVLEVVEGPVVSSDWDSMMGWVVMDGSLPVVVSLSLEFLGFLDLDRSLLALR